MMKTNHGTHAVMLALGLAGMAGASLLIAQGEVAAVPEAENPVVKPAAEASPYRSAATRGANQPDTDAGDTPALARWLDLLAAALSTRYRYVESSQGVTIANQVQYKMAFKAQLKFDPSGRYSLNAGLFTGNNFAGGWNNTGLGSG